MWIQSIWDSIRILVRNKELLIWTLIFPLLMSTLFYFAFGSLDQAERLEPIPVAVVENQEYQDGLGLAQMVEELSGSEDPLLMVSRCQNMEEALCLLEDGSVEGCLQMENGSPKLTVKEEGMNQTILRQVLTQYEQMAYSYRLAAQNGSNPGELTADAESMIEKVSLTHNPPSDMVGYFYSLIAMVCLFGMFQGVTAVYNLQANQSALGARRCLSPQPYLQVMLANLLSSTLIHVVVVWIALAYIALVLKISFGGRILLAAAGCAAGSLTGVSMGVFLGSFPKMNYQSKIGLSVAVTLVLCFFSGMMVGGMNYIVQQHAPVLAWLNPAARLVDALHSLYYFDTLQPFFLNVGILLAFSAVFYTAAAVRLRRYQYESL